VSGKCCAKTIVEKKADCVIFLKGNQSHLRDAVKLFFQSQKENKFKDISFDYFETIDGGHGKIEIRKYWTTSEIDWLQGKENLENLETIVPFRQACMNRFKKCCSVG
jgi:hypothetical protein